MMISKLNNQMETRRTKKPLKKEKKAKKAKNLNKE